MKKTSVDILLASLIETSIKKKQIDAKFCKLLHQAYNTVVSLQDGEVPFWQYAQCNSWNDFVQTKLEISPSRAKKYIAVYNAFGGVIKDESIELKKLELMLPIVTDTNAQELLSMAKDLPAKELKSSIRKTLGTENLVNYSFKFNEEENALFLGAITITGIHDRHQAMVSILKSFVATASNPKSRKK